LLWLLARKKKKHQLLLQHQSLKPHQHQHLHQLQQLLTLLLPPLPPLRLLRLLLTLLLPLRLLLRPLLRLLHRLLSNQLGLKKSQPSGWFFFVSWFVLGWFLPPGSRTADGGLRALRSSTLRSTMIWHHKQGRRGSAP